MPDEQKPKQIEKRKFSGPALRRLRRKKRVTLLDLAKILQRDRSAISRWEQGETIPNAEDVWALCQIFKVPIKTLFTDPEATEREPGTIHHKQRNDGDDTT